MTLRRQLAISLGVIFATVVIGQWYVLTSQRNNDIERIDSRIENIINSGGPSPSGGRAPLVNGAFVAKYTALGGLESMVPLPGEPNLLPVLPAGFETRSEPLTVATIDAVTQLEGPSLRIGVSRSGDTIRLVGFTLVEVEAEAAELRRSAIVAIGITSIMLLVVAAAVNRLAVRPLRSMHSTALALAAGNVDDRIPSFQRGSEAQQLGEALTELVAQKDQAIEMTRRFISDASHELRTPLTTIVGYASLHDEGRLDGETAISDALSRIGNEAFRMSRIVDGLIQLALLDERPHLDLERIDLGDRVSEVVADVAVGRPAINFSTVLPATAVHLTTDGARLRQALMAVLTNAAQHNPPGTKVTVTVSSHAGRALIEVTDDGIGIGPDHLDRIFDRFQRVDRSSGGGLSGGLGLSIVRSILWLLGGRIEVSSTVGVGTTFRIDVPSDQST